MKGRPTVNGQILLICPTEVFSIFFRRREWRYKGEAVVTNRFLGIESKLQLDFLMLTLLSACGRQHWEWENGKLTNSPRWETHTPMDTPNLQPSNTVCSHVTGIEDYAIILFSAFLHEHRH